jgi:Beta-lactamase superfamily domain
MLSTFTIRSIPHFLASEFRNWRRGGHRAAAVYPPAQVRFSSLTKEQQGTFALKSAVEPGRGVYVTFFGANSFHVTDGITNILIDPYFSRDHYYFEVPFWPVKLPLSPDRISGCLNRMNIPKLDAILTTHAHFDHSIDVGYVSSYFARARAATHFDGNPYPPLYGCRSVANVALGSLAPEESSKFPKYNVYERKEAFASLCKKYNINVVGSSYDASFQCADFSVKFIEARHIKLPIEVRKELCGAVDDPLVPERDYYAYKEGEIHSLVIKHKRWGNVLIMGSANYVPGQYDRLSVEDRPNAMILGIGFLHKKDGIAQYRDNAIKPFNPGKVFLSHWDDLKTLLDEDMKWMSHTSHDDIYKAVSAVCRDTAFLPLLECVKVL